MTLNTPNNWLKFTLRTIGKVTTAAVLIGVGSIGGWIYGTGTSIKSIIDTRGEPIARSARNITQEINNIGKIATGKTIQTKSGDNLTIELETAANIFAGYGDEMNLLEFVDLLYDDQELSIKSIRMFVEKIPDSRRGAFYTQTLEHIDRLEFQEKMSIESPRSSIDDVNLIRQSLRPTRSRSLTLDSLINKRVRLDIEKEAVKSGKTVNWKKINLEQEVNKRRYGIIKQMVRTLKEGQSSKAQVASQQLERDIPGPLSIEHNARNKHLVLNSITVNQVTTNSPSDETVVRVSNSNVITKTKTRKVMEINQQATLLRSDHDLETATPVVMLNENGLSTEGQKILEKNLSKLDHKMYEFRVIRPSKTIQNESIRGNKDVNGYVQFTGTIEASPHIQIAMVPARFNPTQIFMLGMLASAVLSFIFNIVRNTVGSIVNKTSPSEAVKDNTTQNVNIDDLTKSKESIDQEVK
uniref:Uncharacterized protein n=1 Tax=Zygnema circumcarinatum TaxID=35869 RepID=Q32RM7_ZYGCR|nr:hypothetical protein P8547_pgp071 [Zygnema circumcarinatum]AAX45883.1 hypothetical protein [Zygnema circumcarinatum]